VAHSRILLNADYQEAAGLEERACVHARPALPRIGARYTRTSIGQDRDPLRILEHKGGGHLYKLTSGSCWVEAVEAEVLRWKRSRQLEARRPKVSTIQLKGLHTNIQQINIK
jgi:hypothetical protein